MDDLMNLGPFMQTWVLGSDLPKKKRKRHQTQAVSDSSENLPDTSSLYKQLKIKHTETSKHKDKSTGASNGTSSRNEPSTTPKETTHRKKMGSVQAKLEAWVLSMFTPKANARVYMSDLYDQARSYTGMHTPKKLLIQIMKSVFPSCEPHQCASPSKVYINHIGYRVDAVPQKETSSYGYDDDWRNSYAESVADKTHRFQMRLRMRREKNTDGKAEKDFNDTEESSSETEIESMLVESDEYNDVEDEKHEKSVEGGGNASPVKAVTESDLSDSNSQSKLDCNLIGTKAQTVVKSSSAENIEAESDSSDILLPVVVKQEPLDTGFVEEISSVDKNIESEFITGKTLVENVIEKTLGNVDIKQENNCNSSSHNVLGANEGEDVHEKEHNHEPIPDCAQAHNHIQCANCDLLRQELEHAKRTIRDLRGQLEAKRNNMSRMVNELTVISNQFQTLAEEYSKSVQD